MGNDRAQSTAILGLGGKVDYFMQLLHEVSILPNHSRDSEAVKQRKLSLLIGSIPDAKHKKASTLRALLRVPYMKRVRGIPLGVFLFLLFLLLQQSYPP